MATSDTGMHDSRHVDDDHDVDDFTMFSTGHTTSEQLVPKKKKTTNVSKIKIKMASAENQSESKVVCTIDLTQNEPTQEVSDDDTIDGTSLKYSQTSQRVPINSKPKFKQAYMKTRRELMKKGVWYNMSIDERLKLRDKVEMAAMGKVGIQSQPTESQKNYEKLRKERLKKEQKRQKKKQVSKGNKQGTTVRCQINPEISYPGWTPVNSATSTHTTTTTTHCVEKVQRVFVRQTKKQRRLLDQLFDSFDMLTEDKKHAFLEQCLDYSCHPSIPKMKHKETEESTITQDVIERGTKFRFIDRLMLSLGSDSKMLIVCDIPYGIKLLRRLSTLNDFRFLELCTALDFATLSDIVQTSRTQVLLTSLTTWQHHGYSTFDVDYLIIMDSIIHPNVDLKLKQTKLIQLVTLSSVDNYVYDYMCINHESLAKSLPQIIRYIRDETNKETQFPRANLDGVLAFQHEFTFFDEDA